MGRGVPNRATGRIRAGTVEGGEASRARVRAQEKGMLPPIRSMHGGAGCTPCVSPSLGHRRRGPG